MELIYFVAMQVTSSLFYVLETTFYVMKDLKSR